jgi:hypothetical protein
VALVQPLRQALVGMRRRVGELLLELVPLGDETFDGLEHGALLDGFGGSAAGAQAGTARRRPPWRVTGAGG